jgi:hypothetical protein
MSAGAGSFAGDATSKIPEPSTLVLAILGALASLAYRRRP